MTMPSDVGSASEFLCQPHFGFANLRGLFCRCEDDGSVLSQPFLLGVADELLHTHIPGNQNALRVDEEHGVSAEFADLNPIEIRYFQCGGRHRLIGSSFLHCSQALLPGKQATTASISDSKQQFPCQSRAGG